MARPLKTGLDYFSLDTEFDDEMEAFIDTFGNDGGMFFIRLWQRAYRTDDGEVSYSGVFRRTTLAKRVNVSVELLDRMVQAACDLDLLDAEALKTREVLTSNGIKKRIGKVISERESARGRKNSTRPEFSGVKTPELPELSGEVRQKGKEKESKSILPLKIPEGWIEFAPGVWSTKAYMTTLVREFGKPCVEFYLDLISSHLKNGDPVEDGGAYMRTWILKDQKSHWNWFSANKAYRPIPNRPPEKDMSKHASRRPAEEVMRQQLGKPVSAAEILNKTLKVKK